MRFVVVGAKTGDDGTLERHTDTQTTRREIPYPSGLVEPTNGNAMPTSTKVLPAVTVNLLF
jgi:hypothetical protein